MAAQWQRFSPLTEKVNQRQSNKTFGVLYPLDQGGIARYLTGVEVSEATDIPTGLRKAVIAAQTYAAFRHQGPVMTIGETWGLIFRDWLGKLETEHGLVSAPGIECYGADFDPMTGEGDIQIWIPLGDYAG